MKRALVLGGTTEARRVSGALVKAGYEVTLALKGLTHTPGVPAGVALRSGGFGGVAGLAAYVRDTQTHILIDATHPFAATMSWNAFHAARASSTRLYAVQRPGWTRRPGDLWQPIDTLKKAVQRLRHHPPRAVLLALGGQGAELFRTCPQHRFQARVLSNSKTDLATSAAHRWRGLEIQRLAHSPSTRQEMAGMRAFGADVMIVRNSGGRLSAKMEAARRLRLPVWVITRPPMPPVPTYPSPSALLQHLGHDTARL